MFFLLSFGGIVAGMLGGLLGIGGGILIMPILRFIVGLEPAYVGLGSLVVRCLPYLFLDTLDRFFVAHNL